MNFKKGVPAPGKEKKEKTKTKYSPIGFRPPKPKPEQRWLDVINNLLMIKCFVPLILWGK